MEIEECTFELPECIYELESIKMLLKNRLDHGEEIEQFEMDILLLLASGAVAKLHYLQDKYKFTIKREDFFFPRDMLDFAKKHLEKTGGNGDQATEKTE